jgi:urease gamma subunit
MAAELAAQDQQRRLPFEYALDQIGDCVPPAHEDARPLEPVSELDRRSRDLTQVEVFESVEETIEDIQVALAILTRHRCHG